MAFQGGEPALAEVRVSQPKGCFAGDVAQVAKHLPSVHKLGKSSPQQGGSGGRKIGSPRPSSSAWGVGDQPGIRDPV